MGGVWFVLVVGMLTAYVLLDGFDLGVGILYRYVGRTEGERGLVRRAIGPVWDANEVWLIAGGGTLFFAFPPLYAVAFSGFYLPLMLTLWLLIGRALGLELRGHMEDPLARRFCDAVFAVSSFLLALVLGAALGNVLRGVPFEDDGFFFLPLWTTFRPGAAPGVLDWYTVLTGAVAVSALALHGAHYLLWRIEGEVALRCQRIARGLLPLTLLSAVAGALATLAIRPALGTNFARHAWGLLLPVAAAGAAGVMAAAHRARRWRLAFAGSALFLAAVLGGAAFALYPTLLPSTTDPALALTVPRALSGSYALRVGLVWWALALVGVVCAFRYLYRSFRGPLRLDDAAADEH